MPTQTSWSANRAYHFPGGLFAVAAVLLFLFLLFVEWLWIVRVTYGAGPTATTENDLGWIWPILTLAMLSWGGLNLGWGIGAIRRGRPPLGYAHLAIVLCCGVATVGLHGLVAARQWSATPLVLDYSQVGNATAVSKMAPLAAAPAAGDPLEGKKLFAMTCVTCHGSTGDGLNNLAPSLRTSEFIRSADTAAITRVVTLGRAIGDPANKSGKMMPAKGGNPFLTDAQIAHLVAFVKDLPNASPNTAGPAGGDAPPVVQLSRWVLPSPASPPAGFVQLDPERDLIETRAMTRVARERRNLHLQSMGFAALAVHGLFLLAIIGVSTHLVFGWLLEIRLPGTGAWLTLVAWGWGIAIATWLLIWWLVPAL